MRKLMDILELDEGITRNEYIEMVKRNPDEEFTINMAMFTTMRSKVGIEPLVAELFDKIKAKSAIEANGVITVNAERINGIQDIINRMESALYEVSSNLDYMESTDISQFRLVRGSEDGSVVEYQNRPLAELLLVPEVVLSRVVRKSDAERYINWITDTSIFREMFVNDPTVLQLVEACKSGALKEYMESRLIKLREELWNFKPMKEVITFDEVSFMSTVRLIHAMNEL